MAAVVASVEPCLPDRSVISSPLAAVWGSWGKHGSGTRRIWRDGVRVTICAVLFCTQDSLAAALVTQIGLRLDRLDAAQGLRGIDDGDAGMSAERQEVLAIA